MIHTCALQLRPIGTLHLVALVNNIKKHDYRSIQRCPFISFIRHIYRRRLYLSHPSQGPHHVSPDATCNPLQGAKTSDQYANQASENKERGVVVKSKATRMSALRSQE